MESLMSGFGEGGTALTLVIVVLGLTIALVLLVWVWRKLTAGSALRSNRNRLPRLSVTDAAIVDDKRRLVLVRRDNIEHLVMIGGPSDIVIEQNIVRAHHPIPAAQPHTEHREPEQERHHVGEPVSEHHHPAPRAEAKAKVHFEDKKANGEERKTNGASRLLERIGESRQQTKTASASSAAATAAASLAPAAASAHKAEPAVSPASARIDEPAPEPEPDFELGLEEELGNITAQVSEPISMAPQQSAAPSLDQTAHKANGNGSGDDAMEDEMQRLLSELGSAR
ncbi:MAG: hypothetical protein WBO55_02180 [Rhizobiaceae bacterium]